MVNKKYAYITENVYNLYTGEGRIWYIS